MFKSDSVFVAVITRGASPHSRNQQLMETWS